MMNAAAELLDEEYSINEQQNNANTNTILTQSSTGPSSTALATNLDTASGMNLFLTNALNNLIDGTDLQT